MEFFDACNLFDVSQSVLSDPSLDSGLRIDTAADSGEAELQLNSAQPSSASEYGMSPLSLIDLDSFAMSPVAFNGSSIPLAGRNRSMSLKPPGNERYHPIKRRPSLQQQSPTMYDYNNTMSTSTIPEYRRDSMSSDISDIIYLMNNDVNLDMMINDSGQQYGGVAGLSLDQIRRILGTASSHLKTTRAKRDVAMICLILDSHLSSSMIASLRFAHVSSIRDCVINKNSFNPHEHMINIPETIAADLVPLHPMTAWALYVWIQELADTYAYSLDYESPVFISSHGMTNDEKEAAGMLKPVALKRDAVNKVFQSIRFKSKVNATKPVVAQSNFNEVGLAEFESWSNAMMVQYNCNRH